MFCISSEPLSLGKQKIAHVKNSTYLGISFQNGYYKVVCYLNISFQLFS